VSARRHAEIAGGGFAGLTLAVALARRGWSVRVHERDAQLRAIGAGIFLWENGMQALEAVGAQDSLRGRTYQAPGWEERDASGRLLSVRSLPLPDGLRLVTLTRRDLLAALVKAAREAGVDLRLGSVITAADPRGAVMSANGQWWEGEVVVGADGINSAVRTSLGLGPGRRAFERFLIYRFLVPADLADDPARSQWRRYADHWNLEQRRRVLYVPCNPSEIYMMLGAVAGDPEAGGTGVDRHSWGRSFPVLTALLERCPVDLRWDHYEAVSVTRWSKRRVALLGDAAHAMPPTLGQGAGTAMVNAVDLATRLTETDEIEAALSEWEAIDRPQTETVQQAAVARLDALFPAGDEDHSAWTPSALAAARRSAMAAQEL
jgi:2-methyl-3-hydroxypyridine 5-carboxylic acid dioxygenase